jgi:cytochrome c peroxidase
VKLARHAPHDSKLMKGRLVTFITTSLLLVVSTAAFAGPAFVKGEQVPLPVAADKVHVLPKMPEVADNPMTAAKVELGKALFFDPRLSANGTISCASCHNPSLGWSDGLKTGVGINGSILGRATPTIINVGYNSQFMWDGRKKSLEDQALGPMKTPEEMKTDMIAVLHMLDTIDGYKNMFGRAFPNEPVSEETMAKAIASFERTVVSKDSRFDHWLAGDRKAITPAEWRGYQVFKDPARGNCVACHAGSNLTDNGYHNIGIAAAEGKADDGRFKIRPVAAMKGAFKTPTLREIASTGPYFHDGSATTLMDVVEHYNRGGDDRSNVSDDVRPLHLNTTEKEDLVAFLKSLTGHPLTVVLPTLPQAPSPTPMKAPTLARNGD